MAESGCRVFLTGFQPFDGETVNPSELLVRSLAADVPGVVLPVDRRRFLDALQPALARALPGVILAMGQGTGRGTVDLERWAHNAFEQPGTPGRQVLEEGAPERLSTRLPVDELCQHLSGRGLPVAGSEDAGRYVCNALYFTLLRLWPQTPSLFVHVPLTPEQAARRDRNESSLPLEVSRRCVEELLAALAAGLRV